jgi:hypothetical protein
MKVSAPGIAAVLVEEVLVEEVCADFDFDFSVKGAVAGVCSFFTSGSVAGVCSSFTSGSVAGVSSFVTLVFLTGEAFLAAAFVGVDFTSVDASLAAPSPSPSPSPASATASSASFACLTFAKAVLCAIPAAVAA